MVICNQLCEWNRYKLGCAKPFHAACPLETALGNTGVANENPVSNADRIRAMSDEELASFLESLCHRLLCDKKYFLEWLKQPAEEAT